VFTSCGFGSRRGEFLAGSALLLLAVAVGCQKSQPATNAPGEPKADETAEAKFDPADPAKTLHWLIREQREARSLVKPGNAASQQEADDKFAAATNAQLNKLVQWSFPVREIQADGSIVFKGIEWTPTAPDDTSPTDRHYTLYVADEGQKVPALPQGGIIPGAADSRDLLKGLKAGDTATVTGRVASFTHDNNTYTQGDRQRRHWMFCVRLKGAEAKIAK
jgi:hypothetical protein